jgi:hypothetical protein
MKRITHILLEKHPKWDWHLHFLRADEKRLHLLEKLDTRLPAVAWEGTETIPMELAGKTDLIDHYPERRNISRGPFVRVVDPTGEEWKHCLHWSASGGLSKPIVGPPTTNLGFVRVVSPPMKQVLEHFVLPDHRFYPVEVTHEVTKERRAYFMLHLVADFVTEYELAYWPAMPLDFYEVWKKKVVRLFPAGSANSYEEFIRLSQETNKELNYGKLEARARPTAFVYREPFDLIWNHGDMRLSEELAAAILDQFGEEYTGEYQRTPAYAGFDPDKDVIPALEG